MGAPLLLLAMFAGSLIIGLRALSPVEHSRRRQLEFTADASHELRTPLSVISAETSIALSTPREAADYRSALIRIDGESQRLRHIVEDMGGGAPEGYPGDHLNYVYSRLVVAARAAGIQAIDGPYAVIYDTAGLVRSSRLARRSSKCRATSSSPVRPWAAMRRFPSCVPTL